MVDISGYFTDILLFFLFFFCVSTYILLIFLDIFFDISPNFLLLNK